MEPRSKDEKEREQEKWWLEMAKNEGLTKESTEEFMGFLGYEGYKRRSLWKNFKKSFFNY